MDLSALIDIMIGIATLLGIVGTGVGAVWVFFRRRVRAWWKPYKESIEGMASIPSLQTGMEELRQGVATVGNSVGMLHLQFRARGDANTETAEFECGPDGANTYVSLTYARWLGVGKAELIGWGWVNFVKGADRERVRREWDECRAQHRVFNMRYSMIDSDGAEMQVDTIITPIPDAPPARQWIGVIRKPRA